jgi:hypothetical protein
MSMQEQGFRPELLLLQENNLQVYLCALKTV